MSLLHRVSTEHLSIERDYSPERDDDGVAVHSSRGRKLSFSPLPKSWAFAGTEDHVQPIGAFEVPKSKRSVQIAIAVLSCLFSAGIVFGYAALKPVLIRRGAYKDLCTPEEIDKSVRVCYNQEIRLNLMFTIAAVATNVAALPVGAILDWYGPRICSVIGSLLLVAGSMFFAFAQESSFDGYIPGYLFLALAGPFIYISSFQLSNTFPKYSGLILALLTGAFDSSSAVFLIYRMLYQWSEGKFTPKSFFLCYLAVPAFIIVAQATLMPAVSYKTVGELVRQAEGPDAILDDQLDESTALLREEDRQDQEYVVAEIEALLGSKSGSKYLNEEERRNKTSAIWGAMHGKSIRQQILSPWFILITLFTVIQMTRINYFVATIRPQYEYILGSYAKAVEINSFFDIALPLGGVFSIPFIGMILDNTSTLFVLSCVVTSATVIGVLGCLPYTWAAYANVSLFVLFRPFYYTAVSDYAAKVFGFRTFGTVYGFVICLAGLFNFSQSGLDALCHKVFHNNPVPINIILLSLAAAVGVALAVYVGVSSYRIRRHSLEYEAEGSRETVVPGAQFPERL